MPVMGVLGLLFTPPIHVSPAQHAVCYCDYCLSAVTEHTRLHNVVCQLNLVDAIKECYLASL